MGIFNSAGYNLTTLVIALLALAVGALGVWYARRALFPPKRRLAFYSLPPAPLLSGDAASAAGISVSHERQVLNDPHLVTISVENTGRHDVSSAQFDGGRPITIDLDSPIKAILKVSTTPHGGTYRHSVSGRSLSIGPDLLKVGSLLTVQALTEGRPAIEKLEDRATGHLLDVDLEFKDQHPANREFNRLARVWTLVGAVAGIASLIFVILTYVYAVSGASVSLSPDNGPAGTRVILSGGRAEKFAIVSAWIPEDSIAGSLLDVHSPGSDTSPRASGSSGAPSMEDTTDTRPKVFSLGQTQADEHGDFQLAFVVPQGLLKGPVEIDVSLRASGSTSYKYLVFHVR
ncbi:hypothetical protein Dvina_26490 [Dactylosporangium vinaceum]|uniref:Uncharacterized protein n=1 Tax=Dactylosporangium vinaceum TaxID=53362 RepID=A0ABV5M5T6_9ACTN|nr:hypothetical protein [Dactylosporangium vinaceum]UAC01276.1 hypothetical protein Dvina_26490 [Dactylosporangium vinaceum]